MKVRFVNIEIMYLFNFRHSVRSAVSYRLDSNSCLTRAVII